MPQTYSSGVPAGVCEVSLISLESCSRLATVASEENGGGSMIDRLRRPHKRTICREPQRYCLWSRGGSLFGTKTSRSTSLAVYDVVEVSIEDPSSSLAETRKLSFKACNRFSIDHTTGIHRWQLSTWCSTPPPTAPLLPFSPFCAIASIPLHPAALAFVLFGIVLV